MTVRQRPRGHNGQDRERPPASWLLALALVAITTVIVVTLVITESPTAVTIAAAPLLAVLALVGPRRSS